MSFKFFLILFVFLFQIPLKAECLKDIEGIFLQGKDYFSRGQYLLATQQFSLYSQLSCSPKNKEKGYLRWAQSLFELNETEEANLILDKMNANSDYFSQSKIIKAWYQPTLVSQLPESDQKRFQAWKQKAEDFEPMKSPFLSGSLSAVVPGLGQVYNGNYQSALFSFVLNALFLATTLEFQNKDMPSAALTSGVLFSVVYVGNIVGTVQATRAINENSQAGKKSDLKLMMFHELSF